MPNPADFCTIRAAAKHLRQNVAGRHACELTVTLHRVRDTNPDGLEIRRAIIFTTPVWHGSAGTIQGKGRKRVLSEHGDESEGPAPFGLSVSQSDSEIVVLPPVRDGRYGGVSCHHHVLHPSPVDRDGRAVVVPFDARWALEPPSDQVARADCVVSGNPTIGRPASSAISTRPSAYRAWGCRGHRRRDRSDIVASSAPWIGRRPATL